jgi:hypothetical protein
MTEQELERALRAALPPLHPKPELIDRICAHIDAQALHSEPWRAACASATRKAPGRPAGARRYWLPASIAAGVLMALGFAQWSQQQQQHQRQWVRAQLLQGLTIASASLQAARSTVLQSEDTAP